MLVVSADLDDIGHGPAVYIQHEPQLGRFPLNSEVESIDVIVGQSIEDDSIVPIPFDLVLIPPCHHGSAPARDSRAAAPLPSR